MKQVVLANEANYLSRDIPTSRAVFRARRGLLVRLEVDRGVDQGLLALAPPEPRHRLPERRVGLDLVDVEAPRTRVALVPAEEAVRRPVWKSNFRRPTPSTRRHPRDCVWLISTQAVAANSPCTWGYFQEQAVQIRSCAHFVSVGTNE